MGDLPIALRQDLLQVKGVNLKNKVTVVSWMLWFWLQQFNAGYDYSDLMIMVMITARSKNTSVDNRSSCRDVFLHCANPIGCSARGSLSSSSPIQQCSEVHLHQSMPSWQQVQRERGRNGISEILNTKCLQWQLFENVNEAKKSAKFLWNMILYC